MSAVLDAREPSALSLEAVQPALVRRFEQIATAPGGVARLRSLLLALAVQGKLVPQRSSEGHASALLAEIRARRSESVRGSAAVKSFDIANREDVEFPCELPAGWVWVQLSDLGQFCGGKTPSKQHSAYWSGSIPWITPKDMKQLRLVDSEDHVSQAAVDDGLALVPPNSLLVVVRSGILRRTVPTAVNVVETTINQDLKALKLSMPEMAAYLQLLIRGFEHFILETLTKVGTTVESIRFDEFAAQPFPFPPLAEQARIVARVDELMRLCDALEAKGRLEAEQHARLLGTLLGTLTDSSTPEELAANWQRVADHFDLLLDRPEAVDALEQTILQLAVRGLLVHQDAAEEPASALLKRIRTLRQQLGAEGKIKLRELHPTTGGTSSFPTPPGWEIVHLGTLIELISGQHLGPSEYQEGAGAGIPYLTGPAEFGEFSPVPTRSTAVRRAVARCGDILITVKGSGVGKLNVVTQPEIAISRQLMAIRPVCTNDKFLFLVLRAMGEKFQSQSVGIAIPGIGREDVTGAVIGLPPLAEQARIVARVEELRRLCTDLRKRLGASQTTQSHLAEALVESAVA